MQFLSKKLHVIIFLLIFSLAAFFRLYGVNWDQGQHLHPDERFLTMVATGISWPKNIFEYLNTSMSPLNPHNRGFGFFVYGTFPVFFTKWVAESLGKGDYGNLTLIGRQLSAFFDLGTVVLVFLIGKQINTNQLINKSTNKQIKRANNIGLLDHLLTGNWFIGLFAAFLYAAMVLPIQLSHFYAVDTYLTFFITLTFYFLIKIINTNPKKLTTYYLLLTTFLGIAFGLALSSKISAVLFLSIIGLGLLFFLINRRNFRLFFVICCLLSVVCFLTFRLTQPYLFAKPNLLDLTLNQKVVDNWKQLKSFDDTTGGFPPAVQWITTKPYLFPLKNMLLWGLGLPLGIIAVIGILSQILNVILNLFQHLNKHLKWIPKQVRDDNKGINYIILLSLFWVLLLFFYQGSQFVKALRYFYPIYPFLAILSGYFLYQISNIKYQINKLNIKDLRIFNILYVFFIFSILFFILLPTAAFLSIYSRPHTRVAASEWIYQNIPSGSIRSSEVWDDGLPLSLPTPGFINEKYPSVEFPLYYPDNADKWQEMARKLQKVDYVILSSNRLYGSIMTTPEKYPVTNRYYQMLFDGSLGFEKIAEFTSRPNLPIPFIRLCINPPWVRYGIVALKSQECPLPGISFVDDYADETFTVYDHPKVIIFKKINEVDYLKALYQ